MLIGYAVSGEPTLLAYNARLTPFAEPFMALFGRNQLPHRSTLSRFLAALDQPTVEVLRVLFQKDVLARNPFPSSGGLFDRRGMQWVVIDVDGTRQAARQRALPQTDGLPAPHRRFDLVCAPGYQGRKRGEVVRTRTVVLQAHTHQFLGTFGGPGNGDYRGELRRAIEVITSYAIQLGLSLSSILVRLDGLYGDAAPLLDVLSTGLGVIARSRAYHLLDLDIVKSRLLCAPDQISTHPESSAIRALYDCLSVPLTPAGPNVRLVIATHAGTSSSPAVGTERDGMVYELFASTLPSPAFTASDVLDLYLHRGSFETVLSDGTYTLSTITLQQKVTSKMKPYGVPLCSDQKFASQPTGGFCTGFFITPSCIMTAGHCIVDTSNQLLVPLSELRFITGFKMTSQTNAITNFKTSQIFTGVQLIRSQSGSSDFAIVQVSCLDGKTQGVPLPISPLRSAYLKESVFAIGYPTGLPTKLAPNAVVQNTGSATTFLTNLDVFRANSGSPVCDVTNTVVGILVNGPKEQDYVPDPKQGCKVLNTFSSPDIPGTIGVQRITGVVGPVYDLSSIEYRERGLEGRRVWGASNPASPQEWRPTGKHPSRFARCLHKLYLPSQSDPPGH